MVSEKKRHRHTNGRTATTPKGLKRTLIERPKKIFRKKCANLRFRYLNFLGVVRWVSEGQKVDFFAQIIFFKFSQQKVKPSLFATTKTKLNGKNYQIAMNEFRKKCKSLNF